MDNSLLKIYLMETRGGNQQLDGVYQQNKKWSRNSHRLVQKMDKFESGYLASPFY